MSGGRLLRQRGCDQLVELGFCWGGKAAAVAARTVLFSGAVSIHGSHQ